MDTLRNWEMNGLAHATHMLGHIALDSGNYSGAYQAFKKSLDQYRNLNDQYNVGTLTSDLGMVAYHQGDYETAQKWQEKSLEIYRVFGNVEVTSQTLHRLGELARLKGNYALAEAHYETCLRNYQDLGMKLEVASNMHKLGLIAKHKGDLEKARLQFCESFRIQNEAGNKQGISECLAGFAGLAAFKNQPVRALHLFTAARSILDACQLPLSPADQAEWTHDYTLACRQLDENAQVEAVNEGRAMDLRDAVAYALSGNGD